MDFHIDLDDDVLKTLPRAAVHELAGQIAGNARSQWADADIVVDDYVTDRAASSVTIREPNALIRQARDGILTRAASSAGVDVRAKI